MTTRINLLPWREQLRKEQDKQLLTFGVFAWAVMGLLVFYGYTHVTGLLEVQNGRNKYLKDEIAKLDRVIKEISGLKQKRRELVERMKVIYKLQSDRTKMVHVMDELVRTMPEGVFYQSLKQSGDVISLKGIAQSNARVAALMRNFEAAEWFDHPNLEGINAEQDKELGIRVSNFTMKVVQRSAPKSEERAEAAAGRQGAASPRRTAGAATR